MTYILLSILSATAILVLFRWMRQDGVNTRHAITINYAVAAAVGLLFFEHGAEFFAQPWLLPAAMTGIFFYVVFRIIALTTQKSGMAIASVATKMSVIIPVLMGLLLLGESVSGWKIAGVLLGLVAVVLSAAGEVKTNNWKWPLVAFVASGLIDASLKLYQNYLVPEADFPSFISVIFLSAFVSGTIHHFFTKERKISLRSVGGGVALGIVNFGSLIFILKSLALPQWESSVIFPINNFGIITLSTLMGILLFRERLQWRGLLSIAFASGAIYLLYLSNT